VQLIAAAMFDPGLPFDQQQQLAAGVARCGDGLPRRQSNFPFLAQPVSPLAVLI